MSEPARWVESWRADPAVRPLADRHYNRQKIGAKQFVPPGACVVLRTEPCDAFWITAQPKPQFVKHAWPGAWMCSAFRNEGEGAARELSSSLIEEAVAVSLYLTDLARVPISPFGFVSFIDRAQTRRKRDPGRCYVKAGWTRLRETTAEGLVVVQLLPQDFPAPLPPRASVHPRYRRAA